MSFIKIKFNVQILLMANQKLSWYVYVVFIHPGVESEKFIYDPNLSIGDLLTVL